MHIVSEKNVKVFLCQYLTDRGADIDESYWRDYDFVSAGVIDSFELLSFILEVSEKFHIEIQPEDFIEKNLKILGNMVAYIEKK